MRRLLKPIVSASVILLLTEAAFSCDLSFDPNTDKFTLPVILRLVAPIFALGSLGLLVLNLAVFFFRRRRLLRGVLITILAVALQCVFWIALLSFDKCLDVFPYLTIFETIALALLTIKHILFSSGSPSSGAQSRF